MISEENRSQNSLCEQYDNLLLKNYDMTFTLNLFLCYFMANFEKELSCILKMTAVATLLYYLVNLIIFHW